jgi:polysaccharide pyruvyl transferase WcaK-like protein
MPVGARPRTATLIGYHGYQNLGDDIFRDIIIQWLGEHMAIEECFLSIQSGVQEHVAHGVRVLPFANLIGSVSRFHWVQIFARAMRSDVLVFGAGSIFAVQPFTLVYFTVALLKLLRGDRLRIFALGVSLGPFKSSGQRAWCLRALARMDRVLLRDLASRRVLAESGLSIPVVQSADLSLCSRSIIVEPLRESAGPIGVIVTERAFGSREVEGSEPCASLLSGLRRARADQSELRVRVLCVCTDARDGDQVLSGQMVRRLQALNISCELVSYREGAIREFISSLAGCSAVIASRLHGGVVAMLCGVPVYQIDYACKATELYQRCQLSGRYLHPASQVTAESIHEFVGTACAGDLQELAASNQERLLASGAVVLQQLRELAAEFSARSGYGVER